MSLHGQHSLDMLKRKDDDAKLVNKFLSGHIADDDDETADGEAAEKADATLTELATNLQKKKVGAGAAGAAHDPILEGVPKDLDARVRVAHIMSDAERVMEERRAAPRRVRLSDEDDYDEEMAGRYEKLHDATEKKKHEKQVDTYNSNYNLLSELTADANGERAEMDRLFGDFDVDDALYKQLQNQLARFDVPASQLAEAGEGGMPKPVLSDAAEQEYIQMLHNKMDQAREKITKMYQAVRDANDKVLTMSQERQNIVSLLDSKYEEVARLKVRNKGLEDTIKKMKMATMVENMTPDELRSQVISLQESNQDLRAINNMLLQENHMLKIKDTRESLITRNRVTAKATSAAENTARLVAIYEKAMTEESGFPSGTQSRALVLPTMKNIMNSFVEKRRMKETMRQLECLAMAANDTDANTEDMRMPRMNHRRQSMSQFAPNFVPPGRSGEFGARTPGGHLKDQGITSRRESSHTMTGTQLAMMTPNIGAAGAALTDRTPVPQLNLTPSGGTPPQGEAVETRPKAEPSRAWVSLQEAIAQHIIHSRKELHRKSAGRQDSLRRLNLILTQQIEALTADRDARKEEAMFFKEQAYAMKRKLGAGGADFSVMLAGVSIGVQAAPVMESKHSQESGLESSLPSGFLAAAGIRGNGVDLPRTELEFFRYKVDLLTAKNVRLEAQLNDRSKRYVDLAARAKEYEAQLGELREEIADLERDGTSPPQLPEGGFEVVEARPSSSRGSSPSNSRGKEKTHTSKLHRKGSFTVTSSSTAPAGNSTRRRPAAQGGGSRGTNNGSSRGNSRGVASRRETPNNALTDPALNRSVEIEENSFTVRPPDVLLREERKLTRVLFNIVATLSRFHNSKFVRRRLETLSRVTGQQARYIDAFSAMPLQTLYQVEHLHWAWLARVREELYLSRPTQHHLDSIRECYAAIRELEADVGKTLKLPLVALSDIRTPSLYRPRAEASYVAYQVVDGGETFADIAYKFGVMSVNDIVSAFESAKDVQLVARELNSLVVPVRSVEALRMLLAEQPSAAERIAVRYSTQGSTAGNLSDIARLLGVEEGRLTPRDGYVEVNVPRDHALRCFDLNGVALVVNGVPLEVAAKLTSVRENDLRVYNDYVVGGSVIYLKTDTNSKTTAYEALEGESIVSIARRTGTSVENVLTMNAQLFQQNPDVLAISQVLVPVKEASRIKAEDEVVTIHPVCLGDTLNSIATKYGVDVGRILDANQIPDTVTSNDSLQNNGVSTVVVPVATKESRDRAANETGALYKIENVQNDGKVESVCEANDVLPGEVRIHKASVASNVSLIAPARSDAPTLSTEPPMPVRIFFSGELTTESVELVDVEQRLCDFSTCVTNVLYLDETKKVVEACATAPNMRTAQAIAQTLNNPEATRGLIRVSDVSIRPAVVPSQVVSYEPKPGDTLLTIARDYTVAPSEVRLYNTSLSVIANTDPMPEGEAISIPVTAAQPAATMALKAKRRMLRSASTLTSEAQLGLDLVGQQVSVDTPVDDAISYMERSARVGRLTTVLLTHMTSGPQTIEEIASRYNVDVRELAAANPSMAMRVLPDGTEVLVPVQDAESVRSSRQDSVRIQHVVKEGQNLSELAETLGVGLEDIRVEVSDEEYVFDPMASSCAGSNVHEDSILNASTMVGASLTGDQIARLTQVRAAMSDEAERACVPEEDWVETIAVTTKDTIGSVARALDTTSSHVVQTNPMLWKDVKTVTVYPSESVVRAMVNSSGVQTTTARSQPPKKSEGAAKHSTTKDQGSTGAPPVAGSPPRGFGTVLVEHSVRPSDTVESIAKLYGVLPKDVVDANPAAMKSNNAPTLKQLSTVVVPVISQDVLDKHKRARIVVRHDVQVGETMADVARTYAVPESKIKIDTHFVQPMQIVKPQSQESHRRPQLGGGRSTNIYSHSARDTSTPASPRRTIIPTEDDTLSTVAMRLETSVAHLVHLNPKIWSDVETVVVTPAVPIARALVNQRASVDSTTSTAGEPQTRKSSLAKLPQNAMDNVRILFEHSMEPHETIDTIARDFEVDTATLISLNPHLDRRPTQATLATQSTATDSKDSPNKKAATTTTAVATASTAAIATTATTTAATAVPKKTAPMAAAATTTAATAAATTTAATAAATTTAAIAAATTTAATAAATTTAIAAPKTTAPTAATAAATTTAATAAATTTAIAAPKTTAPTAATSTNRTILVPVKTEQVMDRHRDARVTVHHDVQPGETLQDIARKYSVPEENIQVTSKIKTSVPIVGPPPVSLKRSGVLSMLSMSPDASMSLHAPTSSGVRMLHRGVQVNTLSTRLASPPSSSALSVSVGRLAQSVVGAQVTPRHAPVFVESVKVDEGSTIRGAVKQFETNVHDLLDTNPQLLLGLQTVQIPIARERANSLIAQATGSDDDVVVLVPHDVQDNDTLETIADQYGVRETAVVGGDRLQERTTVMVPISREDQIPSGHGGDLYVQHVLKPGETLQSLAEAFDVAETDIVFDDTARVSSSRIDVPRTEEEAATAVAQNRTVTLRDPVTGTTTQVSDVDTMETTIRGLHPETRPVVDLTTTTSTPIEAFSREAVATAHADNFVDLMVMPARRGSVLSVLSSVFESSACQTDFTFVATGAMTRLVSRGQTPPTPSAEILEVQRAGSSSFTTYTNVGGKMVRKSSSKKPLAPLGSNGDMSSQSGSGAHVDPIEFSGMSSAFELPVWLQGSLRDLVRQTRELRDAQNALRDLVRGRVPEVVETIKQQWLTTVPFFRTANNEKIYIDTGSHDSIVLDGVRLMAENLSQSLASSLTARDRRGAGEPKEDDMSLVDWAKHKIRDVDKYHDVLLGNKPKLDKSSKVAGKKKRLGGQADDDSDDDDNDNDNARPLPPLELMRVMRGSEGQAQMQSMYESLQKDLMRIVRREVKQQADPDRKKDVQSLVDTISTIKLTKEQLSRLEEIRQADRELRNFQVRKTFKVMEINQRVSNMLRTVQALEEGIEKDRLMRLIELWRRWLARWNEERQSLITQRHRQVFLVLQLLREVRDGVTVPGHVPAPPSSSVKRPSGKIVKGGTLLRSIGGT